MMRSQYYKNHCNVQIVSIWPQISKMAAISYYVIPFRLLMASGGQAWFEEYVIYLSLQKVKLMIQISLEWSGGHFNMATNFKMATIC